MRNCKRGILLCGLLLIGLQVRINAQDLWAIDDFNDRVYRINVNTLTATTVGNLGVTWSFGGMAFDASGTLYGWNAHVATGGLYTINQTTGAATLVNSTNYIPMETIDRNPVNNRTFGIDNVGGNRVMELNMLTGSATQIATVSPAVSVNGSAFGTNGTWYATSSGAAPNLYTINPLTGASSLVGPLGITSSALVNLGYNPADGFLYHIRINHFQNPLYRIDPATGATTLVGNLTGIVGGSDSQITASTFQIAAVPEPTTWAMIAVTLSGAGYFAWRRKYMHQEMLADIV